MITSSDVLIILSDLHNGPHSFWSRNETALSIMLGMLVVIAVQLAVECYKEHRFAKAIAVSFCAEISSIIGLIARRKYNETLSNLITSIDEEFKKATQSSQAIPNRFDLFAPFLQMTNDNFSLVYSNNNKHIGLVKSDIANDIVTFYSLMYGLLEDAKLAGPRIISDTESFKDIPGTNLYATRLKALKECYEEDFELLNTLVIIGHSVVTRCQSTESS